MVFKILFFSFFLLITLTSFSQDLLTDTNPVIKKMVSELNLSKNDADKLDKLFAIHYKQQEILGDLTETNIHSFNPAYTKQAISLSSKLLKYDTLKALTVDLGFIFDLKKEYDSSFVYYNNCLTVFENANKYELTFSITQNIFYNNSLLQGIIKDNNKKALELKQKIDVLIYIVIAALFLLICFLVYYFIKTKKKNKLLNIQKNEISHTKREIDNSISYAQTLQVAILSNEEKLKEYGLDCFVLFMPRDKVSGDFLWSYKHGTDIYIAVADCTGHGVPGALLSIVGYFSFNSIVALSNEKSPAVILELLHNKIVETLNQHKVENNRDGMDVALIRYDTITNKLYFSGANRSLYHTRDKIITEYKSVKRPIGGTQIVYKKPFIVHELELQKNDVFYCYSDGYADQFGGANNKKIFNSTLVNLIKDNSDLDLQKQKTIYQTYFNNHKGNSNQTDDVLVIGIKV